jgi:hypothetical protein
MVKLKCLGTVVRGQNYIHREINGQFESMLAAIQFGIYGIIPPSVV